MSDDGCSRSRRRTGRDDTAGRRPVRHQQYGRGKYVILPGGVPVAHGGHVAGAIGVSGGTAEQDPVIADIILEAARREFKEVDQPSPGNRSGV